MQELNGTLLCVKNITSNIHHVYRMRNTFVAVMLVFLVVLTFFINAIVKHLLKQLYEILRAIRRVQGGDMDVVIEHCGPDEMGELGTQINKMLTRIKQLMDDNLKREMLVKNSEIRALQNQINAHFIYNVLESIKMMAEIDEEYDISDAVTSLGKLLRYSMKWVSGNVLVEQELEYIKNYMALINLRFDYEIYLSLNLPEIILQQEIPKMSLQPIVENAIYHGLDRMVDEGRILIRIYSEGEDVIFRVEDNGVGMSEEQCRSILHKEPGDNSGIGIKNVNDRIKIYFGKEYGLSIESELDEGTTVIIRMPKVEENAAAGWEKV